MNYESVEAVRYLDVNPVLPEDTSEAVKKSHSEILSSLLLNSALAAHKLGGSGNARTAVDWTSRAINRLELSNAEKGQSFLKKLFDLSYIIYLYYLLIPIPYLSFPFFIYMTGRTDYRYTTHNEYPHNI